MLHLLDDAVDRNVDEFGLSSSPAYDWKPRLGVHFYVCVGVAERAGDSSFAGDGEDGDRSESMNVVITMYMYTYFHIYFIKIKNFDILIVHRTLLPGVHKDINKFCLIFC